MVGCPFGNLAAVSKGQGKDEGRLHGNIMALAKPDRQYIPR
jgi:hypothetical protein